MLKDHMPPPKIFPGLELDKHQQESLQWEKEKADNSPAIHPTFKDSWGILYYVLGYETPRSDKE